MNAIPRCLCLLLACLCCCNVEKIRAANDVLLPPLIRVGARWQPDLSPADDLDVLPPPAPPEAKPQPAKKATTKNQKPALRPHRPLSTVTVDVSLPSGLLPTEKEVDLSARIDTPPVDDPRRAELWSNSSIHWTASCLCHRPLYFEERNLERYGYTSCCRLQPLTSAAHFFATIPTLPYQMTVDCPRKCIYTLGHYRPGSCAPWRRDRWPCDAKAGAVEAAAAVGLVFLIP